MAKTIDNVLSSWPFVISTSRTIPYGNDAEIVIEVATIAKMTPQRLRASRPAEATMPTIAEGQAMLIAKLMFAV